MSGFHDFSTLLGSTLETKQGQKPTNEVFGRPVVWSGPAFAGKSVYVRNDEELVKVDLSK